MSKTINTILEVGGVAALSVVTAGAGAALLGGVSLSTGIGATFAAIGLGGIPVSGTVLGGLALAGAGTLLEGGGSRPQQTETAIKSPRPPRVSAYGMSRYAPAFFV